MQLGVVMQQYLLGSCFNFRWADSNDTWIALKVLERNWMKKTLFRINNLDISLINSSELNVMKVELSFYVKHSLLFKGYIVESQSNCAGRNTQEIIFAVNSLSLTDWNCPSKANVVSFKSIANCLHHADCLTLRNVNYLMNNKSSAGKIDFRIKVSLSSCLCFKSKCSENQEVNIQLTKTNQHGMNG